MDQIHIRDLVVTGIVGINPEERTTPRQILINATLWTDTNAAAGSDDIADAVNYRTVARAMVEHVQQGRPLLVERLARELVEICFATEPRIAEVELTVEKPGAVRHARSVGITIRRARVEPLGDEGSAIS